MSTVNCHHSRDTKSASSKKVVDIHIMAPIIRRRLASILTFLLTAAVFFLYGLYSACCRSHHFHVSTKLHVVRNGMTFEPADTTHMTAHDHKYVITVVTASRPGNVSYLANTVKSLYCALGNTDTSLPSVLVVNTEIPAWRHASAAAMMLDEDMQGYVKRGLMYHSKDSLHQELCTPGFVLDLARRTGQHLKGAAGEENDPADRFWWRSKEALDTAYALQTALDSAPLAEFVVFLQDDVMVAPKFIRQLEDFIEQKDTHTGDVDVVTLFTSQTVDEHPVRIHPGPVHVGAVALVMRRSFAAGFASFARDRFTYSPVDGLLIDYMKTTNSSILAFYPNLVQHVGKTSSLTGKQQTILSASFQDRGCWVID